MAGSLWDGEAAWSGGRENASWHRPRLVLAPFDIEEYFLAFSLLPSHSWSTSTLFGFLCWHRLASASPSLVVFFPCFLSIPQSAPDSWWTSLPLPWPVPLLPPLLLALFPMHRQRGSAKVGSVNFLLQTLIAFGCWRGRKFFRCLKPPPEGRNVAAGLWM